MHTTARYLAADDYPIGVPAGAAEALVAQLDQLWGTEALAAMLVPSRAGEERFRRWFAKVLRTGVSPRAAQAFLRAMIEADVRPIVPLIQTPTLILHRQDHGLVPIAHGRYLAEHIRGAKLVELPGTDVTLVWETPGLALDHIDRFLADAIRRAATPSRVLSTVLFTDIVASTRQAGRLGDRRWRGLLEVHDELASRLVEEFHGQLVKTTGDGISPPSTGPDGRSIARVPSGRSSAASALPSGPGCTPARSSCAARRSGASASTSRRG
jgi:hypothetical protein